MIEATLKGFCAAVVFGMGAHVGWAIIGAVLKFLAVSVN